MCTAGVLRELYIVDMCKTGMKNQIYCWGPPEFYIIDPFDSMNEVIRFIMECSIAVFFRHIKNIGNVIRSVIGVLQSYAL